MPVERASYSIYLYKDKKSQPGNLFRLLSDADKQAMISNLADSMKEISGPERSEIINRQLCHWFRADVSLGMAIAQALGVNIESMIEHMPVAHQ
ncbi:MAG TPA: catalase-related domain-containing protein [Sphingobacteriaceae bacterium]